MEGVLERPCSKCLEIKPIEQFYLQRSNAKYPYRLSYCKACKGKQSQIYRVSSPEIYIKENLNRTRRRCKIKGIAFNINFDYVWNQYERQNRLCFYTDQIMLIKALNGLSYNSMSLDKIVPELGYIEGNVVWCINRVNTIKNNISLKEMSEWMPDWYQRVKAHREF